MRNALKKYFSDRFKKHEAPGLSIKSIKTIKTSQKPERPVIDEEVVFQEANRARQSKYSLQPLDDTNLNDMVSTIKLRLQDEARRFAIHPGGGK